MRVPMRLALGLRGRLLGALVLTSVVTLLVAALALLSPLEHRLASQGESSTILTLRRFRHQLMFIELAHGGRRPVHEQLEDVAKVLRQRVDASVTVLDSSLNTVYTDTGEDLNVPDYYGQARTALARHILVRTLKGEELVIADPMKIGLKSVYRDEAPMFVVVLVKHLRYISSAAHVVGTAFLEAAVVGLGIAVLLGLGLTRTLLRRLRRLRDATRELQRLGLDAELPRDDGHDEVSELTRSFAGMRSRLRRQEQARRAFVATASHELRTPLASLNGMLELIQEDLEPGQLDIEDARERTERAREQTLRLSQLSADLLDLTRLDAEVEMRSEPLELGEICRAVAAEFELQAEAQMVELEVIPPPRPCWVRGDPGAVARIVRILLDNALRFTPRGTSIEVRAGGDEHWGTVLVRDHGPGVPVEERIPIFERFQRGSSTGGRGGFGLGLAIGRELAERMGGTLVLLEAGEHVDETPGARFMLRLAAMEMSPIEGALQT